MKKAKIKLFAILLIAFSLVITPLDVKAESTGNDYPIILVHGLGGWGEGEFFGIKYWGGEQDVVGNLNNNGFTALEATVSPVVSNWDRAVELYYYIQGGTVDYGAAHAEEHGHDRYGRTFEGIYPDWDGENLIHLIGHSMGGQTIRMLSELLVNGDQSEQAYHEANPEADDMSPLFEGDKNWIHSIISVATPHNGSTFADHEDLIPFIERLVINTASLAGIRSRDSIIYDFKLDQWGLKRNKAERFSTYMERVRSSKVWRTQDVSTYDLSTQGAQALNSWVDTKPDIYYFSYTGNASYKLLSGRYYPMITINTLMWGSGLHIGSYTTSGGDSSWWPNDGLVSVVSSKYPFGQANKPVGDTINTGEWNYHPVQERWDHLDYIGLNISHAVGHREVNSFYLNMAEQLHSLPKKESTVDEEVDTEEEMNSDTVDEGVSDTVEENSDNAEKESSDTVEEDPQVVDEEDAETSEEDSEVIEEGDADTEEEEDPEVEEDESSEAVDEKDSE